MSTHDVLNPFFENAEINTVFLTPNRRLSATLHKKHQEYQQQKKFKFWHTPQILPLSSWLKSVWSEYSKQTFANKFHLLNTIQENFLWEKIVSQSKEGKYLLHVSKTADLAKTAWLLLKQWRIDLNHNLFDSTPDYSAFKSWAIKFSMLCHENNWIDSASLPDIIATLPHSPSHFTLFGFAELAPQFQYLFKTFEGQRSTIKHLSLPANPLFCKSIRLADEDNEIITMARWAKSILINKPNETVGCVIPKLDKMRDRVWQLFTDVFSIDSCLEDKNNSDCMPFNISAGKSLAKYPIIDAALHVLSLHKEIFSLEDIAKVLHSSFFGDAQYEQIKRASMEAQLRKANITRLDLNYLIDDSLPYAKMCPLLTKRFKNFFLFIKKEFHDVKTYSQWTYLFSEALNILGWPGERSLNSEEYQVVENFLTLLNELATLDHISPSVNYNYALQVLKKTVNNKIFQAKTPHTPIQILGLLEAASLPFDHLWLSGFDDLSFPPQPNPNPFIPRAIQREEKMPHSSAERELAFCSSLIQQFKQSANNIIFSHAIKRDEMELQISPLVGDIEEISLEELSLPSYQAIHKKIFATKNLEFIQDEIGAPVIAEENIKGGVTILKQQALCPFKAFAEWRLHAEPLEKPLAGLRNKDRGTIIHKILEMIWMNLKDHTELMALTENKLDDLILQTIHSVFNSLILSHYKSHYLSLEKLRLQKIIKGWMQVEKSRPPFKVVSCEKSIKTTLNLLPLSLRIDRVDELEDGSHLIIDYKTGKNNDIQAWFNERMDEPQLPLYLTLDPTKTSAITFAIIHSDHYGFKGVSSYTLNIPGIRPLQEIKKTSGATWNKQVDKWNLTLHQLGDEFCSGLAKVEPINKITTCVWCELKPLCRINEEILSFRVKNCEHAV